MRALRTPVRLTALLFLLTWALPAAVSAQETQDTTKLAPELRAARAAMSAAYAKMAGADVATHYADDIIVMFGPDEFRGKAAASAWIAQQLQGLAGLSVAPPTFTVKADEVSERSSYTVTLPDGTQQGGTVETLWRKQGNAAWKVARMTVL